MNSPQYYLNRAQTNPLSLFSIFLQAAVAQSRCTSLVCSCYVAARNSDSKDEDRTRNGSSRRQFLASNIDGILEGRFSSDKPRSHQLIRSSSNMGGFNGESSGSKSNNITTNCIEPLPLKSNLKKATKVEIGQLRMETRKVSWPDTLGQDIAHIQEFEPSVSEDGELESVRNSCVCVIQ